MVQEARRRKVGRPPQPATARTAFVFTDTAQPGIYTVLRSDQKDAVGLFAVNLDSYESDLHLSR